jgi:DNA polymerase I
MKQLVFDIESDSLLATATVIWILRTEDVDTGEKKAFYPFRGDDGWKTELESADVLIGHNIAGFDLPLLELMMHWRPPARILIRDTFVMSVVMDYMRFGHRPHGLESWGEYLGSPKLPFDDFSQYTEEMDIYCEQDVHLNVLVYLELMKEFKYLTAGVKDSKLGLYFVCEQAVARWQALGEYWGWPFDYEAACALRDILQVRVTEIRELLESVLGWKTVAPDKLKGFVEWKTPKWTKDGKYDATMCKWFGIDPWSGFEGEERPILGEYSRVIFLPLSLTSPADVKIFLYRHGWEPSEWNMKWDPVTRKRQKTSPVIVDEDLELLGGNGALYKIFKSLSSRYNVLKTWCANYDHKDGVLRGKSFTIGTPSMRVRHNIIANVPTPDREYGKEMRSLFTCEEDEVVIGGDSAGNQARGLAFYIQDAEFIDTIVNGDIHQYNADKLTEVLREMMINLSDFPDGKVPRANAKRILYAFLFGASGAKLWSYIFGSFNASLGNELKRKFTEAVPGFAELSQKLDNIYWSTRKKGYGWIPGIAGNRIYVDSAHKLLVYLLQACEKATCSAAVYLTMKRLEEANIPYKPCIMYHDEEDLRIKKQYEEATKAIVKQSFIDGPKLFGIDIMAGDAKVGKSWYDVH